MRCLLAISSFLLFIALALPASAIEQRSIYLAFGQDETVPAGSNNTGLPITVGDEDIAFFDNKATADHSDNLASILLDDGGDQILGASLADDILYWSLQSFSDVNVGGVVGGASDIFRATGQGSGTVSLLLDGGANAYFPDNAWIDGLTVLPDESGVYLSFWSNVTLGTNSLAVASDDVIFFDLNTFEAKMVFDYSAENPGLTAGIIALHAFNDQKFLASGLFEDEMWVLEETAPGVWSQELWANGETFGFPANSLDVAAMALDSTVPEPATLWMATLALSSLLLIGSRRLN